MNDLHSLMIDLWPRVDYLAEQGTDLGGYRKMSKSVSKVYISNFTSKSIFKKIKQKYLF